MNQQIKTNKLLIAELLDLDLVNYHLDGFVIPISNYCCYAQKEFTLDEVRIITNYCKQNNILTIAKIDKIMMEEEIIPLHQTIDELIKLNIDYYIYTDTSILTYLGDLGLKSKLINASSKMLCSKAECNYYTHQEIMVIPSSEISLEELKDISSLNNVCLTCYGYLDIFYSKRNLISLYNEHIGKNKKVSKSHKYFIQEETRENENPILENKNGAFIFSDFIYCLYRELSLFNNKMFKINSTFLNKKDLFKIIDIYQDALTNGPSGDGYNKLLDIEGRIGSGFLYQQSNILDNE